MIMELSSWSEEAFNTAPDSDNKIHEDKIAKEFGFKGGLVPGVTISSYLAHPIIEVWGVDWLSKGYAKCQVTSPLYDKEEFRVDSSIIEKNLIKATLYRSDETVSASADFSITKELPSPPKRRNDPLINSSKEIPKASFDVWKRLQDDGCYSVNFFWGGKDPLIYLKNDKNLPDLLKPLKVGFANLSFLLGCSNWTLAGNASMNPWLHLETTSQNFRPVNFNTNIVAEMSINSFYEKKGHEFVDVDVNLYDEIDNFCVMTINLIAIYRLRRA